MLCEKFAATSGNVAAKSRCKVRRNRREAEVIHAERREAENCCHQIARIRWEVN